MDGIATAAPAQQRPPPQPDWVPRHRLDVRDYHRMGEAGSFVGKPLVELVEGELIAMAPAGGPHIVALGLLHEALAARVQGLASILEQSPVRLGDFSEPEPDLMLVRAPLRRYRGGPPMPTDVFLAVEVSDPTLRYDRNVKAALYARHGIPEYWIVDVPAAEVVVHRAPRDGAYAEVRRHAAGAVLDIAALPGVAVSVADILA